MAIDIVPKAVVMSIPAKSNLNIDRRMLEEIGICHLSDLTNWVLNKGSTQVGLGGKLTLPPDEQPGSDDHHTAGDHRAVKSLTNIAMLKPTPKNGLPSHNEKIMPATMAHQRRQATASPKNVIVCARAELSTGRFATAPRSMQRHVKGGLFQYPHQGVFRPDPGHLQLNREGLPGQRRSGGIWQLQA